MWMGTAAPFAAPRILAAGASEVTPAPTITDVDDDATASVPTPTMTTDIGDDVIVAAAAPTISSTNLDDDIAAADTPAPEAGGIDNVVMDNTPAPSADVVRSITLTVSPTVGDEGTVPPTGTDETRLASGAARVSSNSGVAAMSVALSCAVGIWCTS